MNEEPTQKLILIADNDPFIEHAYRAGLEQAGYMVIIAMDGEEATKQVRALRPDLVLLEMILPIVDGFTVLKTIKTDATTADIPVIVLTTLSQATDEKDARDHGAADFLVKSDVSLNDVLLHIERILNNLASQS